MTENSGLPLGANFSASFRTSNTAYASRPPAGRKSARWAWDHFAATGPILMLRMVGGYWGVLRNEDDGPEEIGAEVVLDAVRRGRPPTFKAVSPGDGGSYG